MTAAMILLCCLQAQEGPPAATRIYVYAQRESPARSWVGVYSGEGVLAEVKQGRFFAIDASAGRYTIAPAGGVPVSVELKAGDSRFFRLDWHFELGKPPVASLGKVSPEQAAKEMKFLSYVDRGRIRSVSVPKSDPRESVDPKFKAREVR